VTITRATLRAWAEQPEIAALSEMERLDRAVAEGVLIAETCPRPLPFCDDDCPICNGTGVAFRLGARQ